MMQHLKKTSEDMHYPRRTDSLMDGLACISDTVSKSQRGEKLLSSLGKIIETPTDYERDHQKDARGIQIWKVWMRSS